uniref:GLOBIN domain-containing protein n=1 Tax=Caenorhabditis tropicalis TaxID=1561998 RepID=A0A1I7V3N3_9PELO
MGNSSSSSSRINKKSESMEIRSKPNRSTVAGEFNKSKSMMDMSSKSSRMSTSTTSNTSRQKSITSIKDKDRPKSVAKSTEISRTKSMKKDNHPISTQGRDIISQCFDNPHSEFANKVVQRIFEKREDYQKYIMSLGKERSVIVNNRLKQLVEDIVAHIHDADFIESVSKQYGEEHVELKQYGFKPDFWVAVADAMTLEGVILDMANHQPADTVSAWSSLVTLIFSSVRDGYYSELRRHRMSSRRTLKHQSTVDSREENNEQSSSINPMVATTAAGMLGQRDHSKSIPVSMTDDGIPRNILPGPRRDTLRSVSLYSSSDSASHSGNRNGSVTDAPPSSSTSNIVIRRPIFE